MNKALDFNKLLEAHSQGRLLKKQPHREYFVSKKLDGNYTTVIKHLGKAKYYSSGGIEYFPAATTWLDNIRVPQGVYICERIVEDGKLGLRKKCSLVGPKTRKEAPANHKYMVHDYISLETYHGNGRAMPYIERRYILSKILHDANAMDWLIEELFLAMTIEKAKNLMDTWVKQGYEGIMLKHADWIWKDTKSRTIDIMKWKTRPTADLYCIRTTEGEGKYDGCIGALVLQDSHGRIVQVGSGLSDIERMKDPSEFIHKIIEIEYEQIMDTYIQPTYIGIREDKKETD